MSIPKCPLMSGSNGDFVVCQQEDCAWYLKNFKTCSVYVLAHDAALNIRAKQTKTK